MGAPFNVLPPGATDLVAPLFASIVTMVLSCIISEVKRDIGRQS